MADPEAEALTAATIALRKAALYDELVHALELSVGACEALRRYGQIDERATVKYTAPYEHLGTVSLTSIADATNAVLGKVNDLK